MNVPLSLWIPALWIAWAIYWFIAARGVKEVARREPIASRLAHAIPLAIAALLLMPPALPGWLGAPFMDADARGLVLAIALVAGGLALCVWARVVLGGNWSGTVTLKRDHVIVRSGPYRRIRHPIYTGLLLMFLGSALARGNWGGLLAFAIAAAALWRKLLLEERWLGELFGPAYAEYRASSWALVPLIL